MNNFKRTASICVPGTGINGVVASVYKKLNLFFENLLLFYLLDKRLTYFNIDGLAKIKRIELFLCKLHSIQSRHINSDHGDVFTVLNYNRSHFGS